MSVETKLAASLDDLIAQAGKGRDRKAKPLPRAPVERAPPQTGPRKGLKKNKPEQPQQQPQQQQQQQRPRQQQRQPPPQQQQQQQQQRLPRAPKQLSGPRKTGAANLGVRGGQVQKQRAFLEVPANLLREQPPLQALPPQRRPSYQQRQAAPEGKWHHDMYEDNYAPPRRAPAAQAAGASTKLLLRNLHHSVSSDDVLELFSTCGTVKHHVVNFDVSGRSLGTGHVVFETRAEAVKAKKEYNGVMLDKKAMEIVFSDEDAASKTITKLSSGLSVLKPTAAGAKQRDGGEVARDPREGRANGGQRLAAAAIRETAAPPRGPRGGSLGGRGGRLRSAVVGHSQLDSDLQDYMQE